MHKVKFPTGPFAYILLFVTFVILTLLLPRDVFFNIDYRKGSQWNGDDLVAQFDFPILKTDEQIEKERKKARVEVIPYYNYDEDVLDDIIGKCKYLDLGDYQIMMPMLLNGISELYRAGVLSSGIETSSLYIQKEGRAQKYPFSEVYIIQDVREELSKLVRLAEPSYNSDSLLQVWGIFDKLVPNLYYDEEATNLAHGNEVSDVSPTSGVVFAGEVIVKKGDPVTAEIAQILDSYKVEYSKSLGYDGPVVLQWTGNALIALIITLLLFLSICYTNYEVFYDKGRFVYLLVVFLMSVLMTLIPDKNNPELLWLMPFSLIALYLLAFFKKRMVFPVYFVSLLPLLFFAYNGVELFVCFLFSGAVCILTFSYLSRGWKQFINATCIFVSVSLVWLTFRLMDGVSAFENIDHLYYLFWGSLFTIACYPLIYLFEKIFMLVSTNRLQELSDGNTPLIRDLSSKAPGTFQHCLQVMNMADAAARAIDANVNLVRAGAMYHDIGKILNPQCFVENQAPGTDYHANLSPEDSARDIMRHITDGYELAQKNKLPDVVSEFILTHHGTTCTAFFYDKYLKAGGDPANRELFCYKGKKPVTKEQVILMLSDSLEAASRSLKDYSKESVTELVERISRTKFSEGQLEESDISIKELGTVKDVLINFVMQMYHHRVAYPKRPAK